MNRMKNKLQHIDFESNVGHFYIATGIFGLVFRENARRCQYLSSLEGDRFRVLCLSDVHKFSFEDFKPNFDH